MISFPMTDSAIKGLLATVDMAELAASANRKTGGCLREDDIPRLVGIIARTAERTEAKEASLAGIHIRITGEGATLSFLP